MRAVRRLAPLVVLTLTIAAGAPQAALGAADGPEARGARTLPSCGTIRDRFGDRLSIRASAISCAGARAIMRRYVRADGPCGGSSCVREIGAWVCAAAAPPRLPRAASCNRPRRRGLIVAYDFSSRDRAAPAVKGPPLARAAAVRRCRRDLSAFPGVQNLRAYGLSCRVASSVGQAIQRNFAAGRGFPKRLTARGLRFRCSFKLKQRRDFTYSVASCRRSSRPAQRAVMRLTS